MGAEVLAAPHAVVELTTMSADNLPALKAGERAEQCENIRHANQRTRDHLETALPFVEDPMARELIREAMQLTDAVEEASR